MNRILKVEEHFDLVAYRKRPCPKIRLKGRWLEAVGFKPGAIVRLKVYAPGCLDIQVVQGT